MVCQGHFTSIQYLEWYYKYSNHNMKKLFLITLTILMTGVFTPNSYAQEKDQTAIIGQRTAAFIDLYNQQEFDKMRDSLFVEGKDWDGIGESMRGVYPVYGEILDYKEVRNLGRIAEYELQFKEVTLMLVIKITREKKLINHLQLSGVSSNIDFPEIDSTTTVESLAKVYDAHELSLGLSIGIIKDGKTQTLHYGKATLDGEIPNDQTLYSIGSISKTYTANIAAQMVLAGKINWNDPVNKYLPDSIPTLAFKDTIMTIQHLATHNACFDREPDNMEKTSAIDPEDPFGHYTAQHIMAFLMDYELPYAPGTHTSYSNFGMGLLGWILKTVEDKSYEGLVNHYLCTPLHLENTYVYPPKDKMEKVAMGYDKNLAEAPMWKWNNATLLGAGALKSDIIDMLRYLEANMQPQNTSIAAATELVHSPQVAFVPTIEIGYSWLIQTMKNGQVMYWHNGGTSGFRSFMAFDKEAQIGVVVLSNTTLDDIDTLGNLIMELLAKE